MTEESITVLRQAIDAEWRWLHGITDLPRFLAVHRTRADRGSSVRRLRGLYAMAGERISLGEMLILSGGVHRGDR